ncbi:DNA-binding protein RHL1 isoform X2 [Rhododendron vialii]|uniref:DNA-binding protein RHL1 isoform X2 n=1 Tax=Rhododendron vialii TaxID=182163 RepID=UPI00265F4E25|nr:DNA-binding protein RHL1 isoform X2 [Rhododendron vialii]
MVRGGKKEAEKNGAGAEANPEAEERKRRKRVAFSKGILSEAPAKASTAALLSPSKTVTKHHGKDILRKSQRKNRFLFSFPGLLAPLSGGKIGELKDLGTKNPILYLHFSQGQMKLFGTIVYPKNRYLTLQFSRGGKNVTCEDYFDTMIVFSEAWWIGRKQENPEEARLELPRELSEARDEGYDFKGGAGAPSETKQGFKKAGLKYAEQESPKTDLEDDFSDSQNNFEDFTEVTPVRHSERTAGKRFNFAEPSSAEDLVGNDDDTSKREEQGGTESIGQELQGGMDLLRDYETVHSCLLIVDHDNEDAAASTHFSGKVQPSARSVIKQKEPSRSSHSCLIQPTISTLFKKVEEKKAPRKVRKSPSSKASSQNLQHVGPEKETNEVEVLLQDERLSKKVKVIDDRKAGYKKVTKEQPKVEDDDIEEFSSTSKDSDGSDEDWAG